MHPYNILNLPQIIKFGCSLQTLINSLKKFACSIANKNIQLSRFCHLYIQKLKVSSGGRKKKENCLFYSQGDIYFQKANIAIGNSDYKKVYLDCIYR
jgi:hypothetical protein